MSFSHNSISQLNSTPNHSNTAKESTASRGLSDFQKSSGLRSIRSAVLIESVNESSTDARNVHNDICTDEHQQSHQNLLASSSHSAEYDYEFDDDPPIEFIPPRWMQDHEVECCTTCSNKFDLLNRRHHCRFSFGKNIALFEFKILFFLKLPSISF